MSDKDVPNFAAWNTETLAKFALDAYLKMQEQADIIDQLKLDRKDAIESYRQLVREAAK